MVEHMRKHGYNVGGEQSGHIVLSDHATTGDGLVSALQVMSVVARSEKTVSEICNKFEPLPQVLKKRCAIKVGDHSKRSRSRTRSAPGSSFLEKSGRLVIRPSGTEPVIRVMAEGDDEKLVNAVVGDICDALGAAA